MKVEYLNSLVKATYNACATMLNTNVSHGQLTIKKDTEQTAAEITAVLGMSGKIRGSIVLSFEAKVAEKYVQKLLGSDAALSQPEVCDGVGELCNIVGGSAKVELNKFGLGLNISIPNVVIGRGMKIAASQSYPSLIVPFSSDLGPFALEVCLLK